MKQGRTCRQERVSRGKDSECKHTPFPLKVCLAKDLLPTAGRGRRPLWFGGHLAGFGGNLSGLSSRQGLELCFCQQSCLHMGFFSFVARSIFCFL